MLNHIGQFQTSMNNHIQGNETTNPLCHRIWYFTHFLTLSIIPIRYPISYKKSTLKFLHLKQWSFRTHLCIQRIKTKFLAHCNCWLYCIFLWIRIVDVRFPTWLLKVFWSIGVSRSFQILYRICPTIPCILNLHCMVLIFKFFYFSIYK